MLLPTFTILAVPLSTLEQHLTGNVDLQDVMTTELSLDDWKPLTLTDPEVSPDIPPCIVAHRSFKPTWIENATEEIHITIYDFATRRFLAYRLQLASSLANASSGFYLAEIGNEYERNLRPTQERQCPLKLVSMKVLPCEALPWAPRSLTNSGRTTGLMPGASAFRCFSLFTEADQPTSTLLLDDDIPDDMSITTVEPWSGKIAVGTLGRVRVYHL